MAILQFPDDFIWGTATAAYQIEGSPLADGAGPSIWHSFARTPGRIETGDTGDTACDHYHRWREDIALMKELGLKAYRFSVAWPRVFPTGSGKVNQAGLDFYSDLVDGLLESGIEPMLTLYHWDLPQELENAGGWPSEDTARRFADYAAKLFDTLADRVRLWITFNEPWVFTWLGYGVGYHAPGRCDQAAALAAARNVVLAHGLAAQAFKASAPSNADLGITLSVVSTQAATSDERDVDAARRYGEFSNHWFVEPLLSGQWPAALEQEFGEALPPLDDISGALEHKPDFLGLNYYTRNLVRWDDDAQFNARVEQPLGEYTGMGWEVYPAGLYRLLREFSDRYALPLYVTENGAGLEGEELNERGTVEDDQRLRYLQSHLEAMHRAISEGVDLRGYTAWSFIDNFEWTFGYAKRFGLVHCDHETQVRTPKKSAYWYRRVIEENGI